jgi:predicted RNase H-like HicB family nuclease
MECKDRQLEINDDRLEFLIERLPDGGYLAHCFGACILTEADTLDELHQQIREALCCHFDDGCQPHTVLLRFVTVEREEEITL